MFQGNPLRDGWSVVTYSKPVCCEQGEASNPFKLKQLMSPLFVSIKVFFWKLIAGHHINVQGLYPIQNP